MHCNAKDFTPSQEQKCKYYTKPLSQASCNVTIFWKDMLLFPKQWHKMASKDTPYLHGLQQRHWDKERGEKRWFLPQVSSMLKFHESLPKDYHIIERRSIYFAKSLAWDGFQKHLTWLNISIVASWDVIWQSLLIIFLKPIQGPL